MEYQSYLIRLISIGISQPLFTGFYSPFSEFLLHKFNRNNSLFSKLRDHDTNINQLMSTASYDALQFAAKTYRELFAECRAAYAEMGRAAAGHLEDVKQLETAWPIEEPQWVLSKTSKIE